MNDSLDEVPPVAYASSFAVGIPLRPPNACDGIGRRKDVQGRPLPIYEPEARPQPAAQQVRRRNNRVNQCLCMKQIKDHWRGKRTDPTLWLGVEEENRRREQLSICSKA